MAYFLKKSNLKKGLYLQIYESFYDPMKKETAHKSFKAIGYADDLASSGIEDPVSHYSEIVGEMNKEASLEKQRAKERQIAGSPERHLGHFPLKSIFDRLKVSGYLDLMQSIREFEFSVSDMLEALVYCRVIDPRSKSRTAQCTLPLLYGSHSFSYDQILQGVEYIGSEYEKIIEIFNHQMNIHYPVDVSMTYFDCTNFYFEIDKEDGFRRKGPSKENRNDPIVGLGLLLDRNQTPIGMKLYPGNESEQPVIREVIRDLKSRHRVKGRTIRVADKGLNSAGNVLDALKNGDGYLFSKSVKKLPETEIEWLTSKTDYTPVYEVRKDKKTGKEEKILLYNIKWCIDEFPYEHTAESGKKTKVHLTEKRVATYNPKLAEKQTCEIHRMVEKAKHLKASQAKKNEFGESSKYVTFAPTDKKGKPTDGKVAVSMNEKQIDKDLGLAGYSLFVTSETKMDAGLVYSSYHNLWRIEESFRVMKSCLDARPVFLQKQDSIQGHFLICYLAVLLIRLLQFKVLDGKHCTERLVRFMKEFRVVELQPNKYVNITASSDMMKKMAAEFGLPITNYFLSGAQIQRMLKQKSKV